MNKDIFLVSCYCDNSLKLNSLKRYISYIKEHNFDCALISPLTIPIEIQETVDFYIKISENPVLYWPERGLSFWLTIEIDNKNYKLTTMLPDYGWCGLYHIKKLGEFFKNYNYNKFIFSVYDTLITDEHINEIKKYTNVIFPLKKGESVWPSSLNLFSVHKNNIENVVKNIEKKIYVKSDGKAAEHYIEDYIVKPFNIERSDLYVEDEINHYKNDTFKYSDVDDIKYFMSSYEENKTVKFVFWPTDKLINLNCNNVTIFNDSVSKKIIVDTKIYKKDIRNITIMVDENKYDITQKFKEITKNQIIEI